MYTEAVRQNGHSSWLGARDVLAEGEWIWDDVELFDYSDWRPGRGRMSNNEDCLTMDLRDQKWNERDCSIGLINGICEFLL